ncbi:type ISP restriction/modification enzyme [Polaribacter glomeratus]|uniref:site-specific DNA-methyltransferase (adenine-specific) n=1 Tax=Polaribacter glomeratus TaxID=102 RepID=A0A2S7WWF9_9FLAO|nr:type ISP restriction/modification enzyme [Polaribacter glomeratus]PQJ81939.1 DNA methyltransferase [Polaribacter glomeratus]TXD64428.1 N-6 DNA methylase [Polaribacter glomeratus]
MTLESYIDNLNQRYTLGNATEHTFRGDLQQLLETILPDIRATNEPKRQSCGAPDYILTKKDIPVGFIEAKDIGDKDLEGKKKTGNKEQFDRYKASLTNLIFTDYLDFHIYQDGAFITKIAIAEVVNNQIKPIKENFETFTNLLKDFATHVGQTIKSSKKLAEMMAGKARLLSDVIEKALTSDENHQEDSTLKEQMLAFKDILIHDITPKGFADVYAQTIAYGMFAARLHDPTLDTFSRQEAAELIPKSNPFLRKLFGYIAGPDIDDRIKWIVENLSEIFLACNVEDILKNYGKSTKMEDPIIHFYETFLAEYDPKLRKARGVWYTPAPIVNFIVRAVDDILKTEFNLPQGLADSSKTTVKVQTDIANKNFKSGYTEVEKEVHKVQILDPATGTGTFLAEVIKHVHKKFKGQEGIWSSYAENNLLPRLNGFELLMASYAMAHLQIDLLLKETGFKATKNQRTKVYLTNSLEEYHPDTGTLFANWLSSEANEANHIKRDTPVMCIIGNPPYAVSSTNKGAWIENLLIDYKKDLNERSYNSLSDDYVKFIRYGQYYIEKNGEGILAYISNNSFIDGIVFRQMRKNILETFDKVYILDLHGNAKKKETAPDGSPDQNVFDIMQGVSINIFVKTGKKKTNELGQVLHYDLFGKREFKYDFLKENSINPINWNHIKNKQPNYLFIQKNYDGIKEYESGIKIDKLINFKASGMVGGRDSIVVNLKDDFNSLIDDFQNKTVEDIQSKYGLKDSRDWSIKNAIKDLNSSTEIRVLPTMYKAFDKRYVLYTGKTKGIVQYPRQELVRQFNNQNLGLSLMRSIIPNDKFNQIMVTNCIIDKNFYSYQTYNFPLYLYPEENNQISIENSSVERTPNLNLKIVNEIAKKLGLVFVNEKETDGKVTDCFVPRNDGSFSNDRENGNDVSNLTTFAPIDILDYIYAVLHSPTYREKYKEFLKIDFPRVPYPKDTKTFWKLVQLGGEIRQLHLLESEKVNDFITNYTGEGDNVIRRKITKTDIGFEPNVIANSVKQSVTANDVLGKVWINDTQYFDNVPLIAWEFYIGGYQPAQKWLKDRKDRVLEFDDIFHYSKIIVSLTETHRLMQEIDAIEIE